MSDLINRQDALNTLKALEEPALTAQYLSAIFDCEDAIKALPSIEKYERDIVKPIKNYQDEYICSKCRTKVKYVIYTGYFGTTPDTEFDWHVVKHKFCPECGAKIEWEY